jgi:hypothetical protein
VRAAFALERYLTDLRDRTAWAPDCAIEEFDGPGVPRPVLHRIAHLWAVALLDDRFETLLLPVLVTASPLLDVLERENPSLPRGFFAERLTSGACLLLIDGPDGEAVHWPGNRVFYASEQWENDMREFDRIT